MISRFRVRQDLKFRKSKTGKVSTFDSRSWEPRTHPRTPLSHQNKPEQHARLSGWECARHHWEAGALNCQKRIIKKDWACAQRCQILLRQIILINFSLDLNLGARASLCISFLQIIVLHLGYFILSGFPVDFVKVRGFLEPVNDMDCREGSAGPCSISPVFTRVWGGIISFEFVTISNYH